MKKIISSLMIMLVLMSCLVGCKDDSYAGLAVPEMLLRYMICVVLILLLLMVMQKK